MNELPPQSPGLRIGVTRWIRKRRRWVDGGGPLRTESGRGMENLSLF